MSPRARVLLIVAALLAAVAAAFYAYRLNQPVRPPLPSENSKRREEAPAPGAGVVDPADLNPSVQSELDCVDRLLAGGAPEGANVQAEWARCASLGDATRERGPPDDSAWELNAAGNSR